jgi:hypothetical protein
MKTLEGASSLFTWTDEAGTEHTLDVDVVSSGVDERTAQLTDHVVETGATITDHVVILPETLSLELVVTQTPVNDAPHGGGFGRSNIELDVRPSQFVPGGYLALSSGLRSAVTGLFEAAGSPPTAVNTIQSTDGEKDRVSDAHDALIRILQGALLVTVSFKGRIYEDYLLTRVTLTSNPGEFGMGRFSVDARAFRTVTGATAQLPDPADFRALPKAKTGNKPPKTPDPDPTQLKSLAASGLDSLF